MFFAAMVRNYKRKTDRASYSVDAMHNALAAIKSRQMSTNKASIVYGIPRTTLIKRMRRPNQAHQPESLGRYRPVFTIDFENELVMHAVEMQQRFYGLSLVDFRSLAYQLAERNGIAHPFSREQKRAGRDWCNKFLKRYPELSLRLPEPTSMARLSGFNKVQVAKFFDILKAEIARNKFAPDQIYNIDETGITTVQTPGKVLARKGAKQVGRVVSAERGTTTTVVCGMNAAGTYVPPMFLFKRKNMNHQLMKRCPPGSIGVPSASGWMDSGLFTQYLQHFIAFAKPSESRPVLILLDGHQSHKSLDAVTLARENCVTLITIPPHTSHRLQPLDLTFFGPLKQAYNREVDKWMLHNPGKRVTDYELCEIFSPAYLRVANIDKAVNGFKCSGICPLNADIFDEEDFAPATVTEQPMVSEQQSIETTSRNQVSQAQMSDVEPDAPVSKTRNKTTIDAVGSPTTSMPTSEHVSVLQISPYPRTSSTGTRKRKAEVSTVLTSTPNKKLLEEKHYHKQSMKSVKEVKKEHHISLSRINGRRRNRQKYQK